MNKRLIVLFLILFYIAGFIALNISALDIPASNIGGNEETNQPQPTPTTPSEIPSGTPSAPSTSTGSKQWWQFWKTETDADKIARLENELNQYKEKETNSIESWFNAFWNIAQYIILPLTLAWFFRNALRAFGTWIGSKIRFGEGIIRFIAGGGIIGTIIWAVVIAVLYFIIFKGYNFLWINSFFLPLIKKLILYPTIWLHKLFNLTPSFLKTLGIIILVVLIWSVIFYLISYFIRKLLNRSNEERDSEEAENLGRNLKTTKKIAEEVSKSIKK